MDVKNNMGAPTYIKIIQIPSPDWRVFWGEVGLFVNNFGMLYIKKIIPFNKIGETTILLKFVLGVIT